MPAKPKSTSKSGSTSSPAKKTVSSRPKAAADTPVDDVAAPTGAATPAEPDTKVDTLDLIGEKPRRVRNRIRAAAEAAAEAAAAEAAAAEAAAAPPPPPKKEVLSLIDEAKPRRRRPAGEAPANVVPPISKILKEKEDAAALYNPVAPKPAPEPEEIAPEPDAEEEVEAEESAEPTDPNVISIKPPIIVKDLAELMGVKVFHLIKDLMEMDIFANPAISIEPDIAAKVCEKHGFIFEREKREKGAGIHKVEEIIEAPPAPVAEPEDELKPRPPIITFMGHVDHGKTSLIDAIRKTTVTKGEAGGITQHVAAYSVEANGQLITILDTPGHAAFTAMRARGAMVTDIVILVVAANDGVMPQTKEAIAHAKAAGVKIVVALNKCDVVGVDLDRVKGQLQENGVSPEDWGGDTICIPVSATKGIGIDQLLESTLLEAEILELRANPKAPCRALVIESRVVPGKGPTATVIPQTGTIKTGTAFICGPMYGKVKSILDDRGKAVKSAGPAMPVEVIGFSALPNVGDELVEMDSERDAKTLSEERTASERQEKLSAPRRASLESLFASMEPGQKKVLKIILKADVQGSQQAIVAQLHEIVSDKVRIEFLLAGVGPITENDILLASASEAIVIGFNTRVEGKAVKTARAESIQIKLYSIIYELMDQVKDAMLGLLDPELREKVIGHAQVKQIFKIQRARIAGSVVTDGRLQRNARARVLRGKTPVYDGGFQTLRRFQDDVGEVRNGLECGIRLGDFNDYEMGDIIECYELEKIAQTL